MIDTAQNQGLVGCRRCARVWPKGNSHCGRCGAGLVRRDRGTMLWVWIWWSLGLAAFLPAMLLPMLETRMLFRSSAETILGGAAKLAAGGSWGVAAIIVLASVVIPAAKFLTIALLAIKASSGRGLSPDWAHRLYHVIEIIGRWSMVDIFVVAILASLVKFSYVATISPGPAALAFALSVIFTMLSAQAFDPRHLWDENRPSGQNS